MDLNLGGGGGGGFDRTPSHLNTDQLLEKSISHHENDFTVLQIIILFF